MKKKAFLQALIIVILLVASWLIFLNRSQPSEDAAKTAEPPEETIAAGESGQVSEPSADSAPEPTPASPARETAIYNLESVPPQWMDWMTYLQQQMTPAEIREALFTMRDGLFSMDPEDGSARLIELILSRADLETGLAFQVGEGGNLVGAPSMQVLLVDWLGQMDPARAAALARMALNAAGTQLGPDLYVMHLRNVARGENGSGENRGFIRGHFITLLKHDPWIENPTSSVAEAMDIAVYLEDPSLVAPIANLNSEDKAPRLRHASSLALERLIDQDPVPAVEELLASPGGMAMDAAARAGFVARVDPAAPGGDTLLKQYLTADSTSPEEAALFLAHFPNLNQSLSHNLLSTHKSNTAETGHMERLQHALEAVRSWQADPEIPGMDSALQDAGERLVGQLTGKSAP